MVLINHKYSIIYYRFNFTHLHALLFIPKTVYDKTKNVRQMKRREKNISWAQTPLNKTKESTKTCR